MSKQFQIDELIGEYRVTRFLGKGGMGEVYLGVHEKLGRAAAIKILGADSTDESFRTRFFNEARLQASLHHPNIATLYDFQEQDSELLIFMEYVDGESLDELVTRREFSAEETLGVFASVCDAVAYMHQNGIVHRDIKSQNVKLTSGGTVKLLDFGIAKDLAGDNLTRTGGVVGTPNYLSPEQLEGKPATPRSDVWALGVLLYEMLTGVRPFGGDNIGALVLSIATTKYTSPENINPAVPRAAVNIVRRCLKKDPNGRYESVEALAIDVRSAIGRQTIAPKTLRQAIPFISAAESDERTQTRVPRAVAPAPVAAASVPSPAVHLGTPKEKSSGAFWLIGAAAVAVVLVLIAGGIGIAVWSLSSTPETVKLTGPANKPPGNREIFGSSTPATNADRGSTKVETAKAPDPEPKTSSIGDVQHIRIDVDEGKADVTRNGATLGSTPLDIDVAIGRSETLTLKRDGYEDKEVTIEASPGKKAFTFSLKPKK